MCLYFRFMKFAHLFSAAAILVMTLGAPSAKAVVVHGVVTQLAGSYLYEIFVLNDEAAELLIVSLIDAPLADPLIGPTLTTPVGFLGNYDSGLGYVDLIADTTSFLPGSTVDGFSFESLAGPGTGYFTTFEAIDASGNPYSGPVTLTVNGVPETGGTLMMSGLVCAALGLLRRRKTAQD